MQQKLQRSRIYHKYWEIYRIHSPWKIKNIRATCQCLKDWWANYIPQGIHNLFFRLVKFKPICKWRSFYQTRWHNFLRSFLKTKLIPKPKCFKICKSKCGLKLSKSLEMDKVSIKTLSLLKYCKQPSVSKFSSLAVTDLKTLPFPLSQMYKKT